MTLNKLSRKGRHHTETGEENQDFIFNGESGNYSVITLADGVSTCRESKIGAEIAAKAITDLFLNKADLLFKTEKTEAAKQIIETVSEKLNEKAKNIGIDVKELSSTLISVVYDKENEKILCFNLGDGLIVSTLNGKIKILSMPSDSRDGCCVTTTDDAFVMTDMPIYSMQNIDSVMLCSDGAWQLMFNKNKMKSEVYELIINKKTDELKKYLINQNGFDDYSFISLENGRNYNE